MLRTDEELKRTAWSTLCNEYENACGPLRKTAGIHIKKGGAMQSCINYDSDKKNCRVLTGTVNENRCANCSFYK